MFENIIYFSIRNKLIVFLLIFLLIGLGLYSMQHIPINAIPDITNNQVQVVTVSPSLAPQEVEKFITYPVEVAMANIPDVIEIRSISRYGLSVVTIVFNEDVPMMIARQYVGEQINLAAEEIPEGLGVPELMPITTGLGEIYQYTLEVEEGYEQRYDAMELRSIQDWIVKRQLSGLPGIVEISSFGGFLKQYEVAIEPARLQSFGLTIAEVFRALEANNQNSGGSYIEKKTNAYYIRAEGLISQVQDIENIVVTVRNGIPVLVRDLAVVQFGHAKRFGAMTKNGQGEAVGGITLMLKGANSSQALAHVHQRISQVQKSLPEGVYIEPYLDRSEFVSRTINTVKTNLIEGGLIVIFVLILLLGNWRAGLIVASIIPLSLLFAFIMMNLFGVSANLMSLGAVDFGIVVDGAVIIVEAILHVLYTRHLGKHLQQADMDRIVGQEASTIFKSAAFGVLIIIVVFIPVMTLTGTEGKMFRPMAQTVSFAVIGALLLSLTFVPVMAALFLKKKIVAKESISDKLIGFLRRIYLPVLQRALHYRKSVVSVAFTLFIASVWSFLYLGGEFIPTLEEGDLAMQMAIPPGSSLQESVKTATKAEQILMSHFPEVKQVVSKIGTAEVPTDPMAIEDGDIMIILKDKEEWVSASSREELVDKMKKELAVVAGASFNFTQPIQLRFNELMTGAKTDIAVKIYGEELEELYTQAHKAAALMAGIPGAADIKVEQIAGLPQLIVHYDRSKIAQFGLNIQELNTVIRAAYAGETAGVVFEGERKYDLVVRLNEEGRENVDLHQLHINTPQGSTIPVSEVAQVDFQEGPMQISRDDTKRRVVIGINVRNRDIESLVEEIQAILDQKLPLPPGYYISYGGDFENLRAAKQRLSIAVPIALGLILLLLYFTFGSVKYAILIFTAVPLSAIGGIAALWIREMPFSISAGVGFIALFGVAVLNGIVLISYFNHLREEGETDLEKVVITGGLARLRPVIMTAAVASLGFLPMALSNTAGAEVQKPLATVVIGGLVTATLLTLVVLPVLYLLFNQRVRFSKGLLFIPVCFLLPVLGNAQHSDAQHVDAQHSDAQHVDAQHGSETLSLETALDIALQQHPEVENARLEIVKAQKQKKGIIDLPGTSFTYQYGQINSPYKDPYLSVRQSLGSPLTFAKRGNYLQQQIVLQQTRLTLTEQMLTREVTSAYYQWLYEHSYLKALEREISFYSDYFDKVQIRYETGEIDLLDKTLAEAELSELKNEQVLRQAALEMAENQLKKLMVTDTFPYHVPTDTLPRLSLPTEEGGAISEDNLWVRFSQQQFRMQQAKIQWEKARLFPEISIGYFHQRISEQERTWHHLQGWEVGISLPLWFLPQQSRISEAKIEEEQAANALVLQRNNVSAAVDQLLLQVDQLQKQLAYYEHTALPQATIILQTAAEQFDQGEVDYFKYLQSLSAATQIKINHLKSLNEYNQALILLAYYL